MNPIHSTFLRTWEEDDVVIRMPSTHSYSALYIYIRACSCMRISTLRLQGQRVGFDARSFFTCQDSYLSQNSRS